MTTTRKIALVTGSTGSIGRAIATIIAAHHYTVILPVRDANKGEELKQHIIQQTQNTHIHLEHADLAQRASIQHLCDKIRQQYGELHLLINNASVCPLTRSQSEDGLELSFAVNVFAYYCLMTMLHPLMADTATKTDKHTRFVNVSSDYAGVLDTHDLQCSLSGYDVDRAYRQSKQAERAMSWYAAALWKAEHVTVNACNPGEVDSVLNSNLGYSGYETPEQGAATPCWLALAEQLEGVTGKYYSYQKEKPCPSQRDKQSQQQVWEYCAAVDREISDKQTHHD